MRFIHQLKYNTTHDFIMSLFPSFKYKSLGLIVVSVSAMSGFVEVYFGMKLLTLFSFILLLAVELISGMYASVFIKKQKLESAKMQRFTIKLTMWLIALFIVNSFFKEFETKNILAASLFEWLHDAVMIYAALEYLVSVLENISVITGDTNNKLLAAFKAKVDRYFGDDNSTNNQV